MGGAALLRFRSPTPTLDALRRALTAKADGATVMVRYYNIGDKHNEQVAAVRLNHRWFKTKVWQRNDATGLWDAVSFPPAPALFSAAPSPPAPVRFLLNRSPTANAVISCLCKVGFNVLHAVDGAHNWHFVGCGLVVCARRGLVVVDRNTVVVGLGEATVTFACSAEVPAAVVFLHPTHNFAVVQYDPSRFAPGSVESATLCGDWNAWCRTREALPASVVVARARARKAVAKKPTIPPMPQQLDRAAFFSQFS